MPHLLVVVVEALPVGTELFEAGLVDVVDPEAPTQLARIIAPEHLHIFPVEPVLIKQHSSPRLLLRFPSFTLFRLNGAEKLTH